MAAKFIILHGLPGSGKSTYTASYINTHQDEKVVIVNRDTIRENLFGKKYHERTPDKKSEQKVTQIQDETIRKNLAEGNTVIDDNTNLETKFLKPKIDLARKYGAIIEQKTMDISIEECKKRNKARGDAGGRFVPEHVIDRMAAKSYDEEGNIKDFIIGETGVHAVSKNTPGMKLVDEFNRKAQEKNPFVGKAILFVDVDGTLANNAREADRAFGSGGKKDFSYFFRSIEHSKVNTGVRDLANKMRDNDGLNIVVLTGREDGYARELISFIERSGIKVSKLIVKRNGDFRKDYEFKKEQIDLLKADGFIPVHSLDDRAQSAALYEKEGISVSRVEEHIPVHPSQSPKEYPEPKINTIYGSGYCIRCGQKLNKGNIGPKCKTKL